MRIKNLLVFLLLAVTMVCIGQEKVLLRLNYEKGDVYETSIEITNEKGEDKKNVSTKIVMQYEVKDVSEKEYESAVRIKRIMMNISKGDTIMFFDSSKSSTRLDKKDEIIKAQIDSVLKMNAITTIKSDKLGKVKETKTVPNVPGFPDFTKVLNDIIYPVNEVSVGDNWSVIKGDEVVKYNFVYKVVSITSRRVILEVSGKVGGEVTGNIEGTVNINKKSGVLLKSNIDTVIENTKSSIKISTKKK
ncbi:hypothetical protein [Tenacibaculum ovolyticum]|uniref:hypothetical protein n=1 Tax=Tenacibaculum ovolyticum TaxID=104270 RepID=UPI00041D8118|nr:hypothetical protein [Tenacibaculum ovolyticum]